MPGRAATGCAEHDVNNQIVHAVDLLPTFAELIEGKMPDAWATTPDSLENAIISSERLRR
ncbi:hypothetical protein R69608_06870 [Paraburkholderia nemoris]|jgi:hypothetical protein|uniref:hypothetical protein n=1 Tax=Paraburkholderia nemoris TaxID=2793076 RepID=UPI0019148257|nr:hypothetical protein [Paraburkholderia nemoris]MBK5153057.1 hypothetical protein [Burkholderia sp. R-69608]CAE6965996.1 hypothetical protein R69608_06870 [Paraburkholderia nemoris]